MLTAPTFLADAPRSIFYCHSFRAPITVLHKTVFKAFDILQRKYYKSSIGTIVTINSDWSKNFSITDKLL